MWALCKPTCIQPSILHDPFKTMPRAVVFVNTAKPWIDTPGRVRVRSRRRRISIGESL
jgi:hypothetical protein